MTHGDNTRDTVGVETLPKISMHERYRRTTDRQTDDDIYSERERRWFTFAKY